jgi:hypothetical protein
MTLASALYFASQGGRSVPWTWLEAATRFLADNRLPVEEVEVGVIEGPCEGHYKLETHQDMLFREVQRGNVNIIGLYSHPSNPVKGRDLVMNWRGLAYLDLTRGDAFLGVPDSLGWSPRTMACFTHDLYKDVICPSYGIAYWHPALEGPDFYAVGILAGSSPPSFDDEAMAHGDRVAKWYWELRGPCRHLKGWFRDVYPANLLSDAHLDARLPGGRTLRTAGIGGLFPLEDGLWLWEVPDREAPAARAALAQAGLLICA